MPIEVRAATAAMGTRFELVVLAASASAGRSAAEGAIEVIEETHRRFSRFESTSLLSHLRRVAPMAVAVDRDTWALFADALAVRDRSGRAFDPCPLAAGAATIVLGADGTVGLADRTVEVDLGGIAKGHGLDLAARFLREAGITAGFLHGGTSSGVGLGAPPGTAGWRVALGGSGGPVVTLRDQAFSFSSTMSRREGRERAHLVDPRTGLPILVRRRAAVVGPSARLADAWSTAVVVSGTGPNGLGSDWTVSVEREPGHWLEAA